MITAHRSESDTGVRTMRTLGAISGVVLGSVLLASLPVFGAYIASTGVRIPGNNPAVYPERLAQSLVNGAATPYWTWYLLVAALSVLAFTFVQSLAERLDWAGSRLPIAGLGTAALLVYAVLAITTATIEREAGSAVLTRSELVVSIPVLFGVLIPVLLGSFHLLAAAWILAASWAGWRTHALPRWLSLLGGVTSLALLAGVMGSPGLEILAGPWLIVTGVWMVRRRVDQ